MAQKLDANLNVIQETPIELELINGDLSIISKLDDEPNDVGGLTSTQLKAKFDEAGNIIKEYLNNSLIPAVLAADATEATRSAAEAERVENELERVANENVRVPAETARIAAENIRIENEATRVASEEERIDAEETRKANEAQRIANENAREDLETGYVARAEAAAKRAEDAAADAENTVGGDYVTQEELDDAIGAIPTPDVYTKTETLTNDTKGLFGLGSGAVPNDVFDVLKNAALYKQSAKTLDSYSVGDSVEFNETINGATAKAKFIVVSKDYKGTGRVLLWRSGAVTKESFGTNGCVYANSAIDAYFSSVYINCLDAAVQEQIVDVDIEVTTARNSSAVSTMKRKVFALSLSELGLAASSYSAEGSAIGYFNSTTRKSSTEYWTRTIKTSGTGNAAYVTSAGEAGDMSVGNSYGYVPAFTLPSAFVVRYESSVTDVLGNTLSIHAKQIFGGIQIATGSYKGTGKYGQSNPNSLTFDFEPKLVIITRGTTDDADGAYSQYASSQDGMFFMRYGVIRINSSSNTMGYDVRVKFDGKTVSWYTTQSNAECQANASSTGTYCYHYIAIG